MIILEENFKWHLEAFASELFIYYFTWEDLSNLNGYPLFKSAISQFSGVCIFSQRSDEKTSASNTVTFEKKDFVVPQW